MDALPSKRLHPPEAKVPKRVELADVLELPTLTELQDAPVNDSDAEGAVREDMCNYERPPPPLT